MSSLPVNLSAEARTGLIEFLSLSGTTERAPYPISSELSQTGCSLWLPEHSLPDFVMSSCPFCPPPLLKYETEQTQAAINSKKLQPSNATRKSVCVRTSERVFHQCCFSWQTSNLQVQFCYPLSST